MGLVKQRDKKFYLFCIFFALVFIICALYISGMVKESSRLKQFRSDVFMICNDTNVCYAEGPDGKVKVDPSNLPAIRALLNASKGKLIIEDKPVIDQIELNFDCEGGEWTMLIGQVDNELIKVEVRGTRNYIVYLTDASNYDRYVKAVSLEGINAKNKPIS
ncbi:hypothetical protein [Butyrivibrio proteoclasticus]|uniref:hypothetical protein n=1 Tax=Butyrivibrio proteoclasticus TaxID=43305 RepID=UPI00047D8966|nr:hypothetical protein [Butyrivibrio proteoclasticus]